MKPILYTFLLLFTINCFAQDLMKYEFDENLSLNIPENAEEVELAGQSFIRGYIDTDQVIISMSDKGKSKLSGDNVDLSRFYQGMRDGMLKGSNGKAIKEEIIVIDNVKVLNFVHSMEVEGQPKIIDNYVFVWKGLIYTIKFVGPEGESDSFKMTKKTIIDSIEII